MEKFFKKGKSKKVIITDEKEDTSVRIEFVDYSTGDMHWIQMKANKDVIENFFLDNVGGLLINGDDESIIFPKSWLGERVINIMEVDENEEDNEKKEGNVINANFGKKKE